ncbi:TPA: host specificity protein J [Citrobacter freundii]
MQLLHGETIIQGAKGGGGSAHTPVEQPDDLLSVAKLKMLIAVSEGEIQGDLTAQSIFLNDTPLANDSGEYNFSGVKWEFRKGTQDQTYIAGMPQVDNELAVGTTVTTTAPWTRQFTNLSLDAIRIKLSLPVQYLYKDNGDMVGTVTEYAIDLSTDGGAWKTVVNGKFDGKTTTEYQRDHRIDLPKSTSGWSVRVRRITVDASGSNSKLVNAFKVFSYAEVIDSKLRYPLTALLYVEVDSSQFNGSAPKVTCKIKGKLIKVPDNYDPITRTYSGSWSGGFKMAWSNNPAWIFYDLVLDEIYGMGTRVDASMVDKWALYSIAQYCDEMVSDGAGGTEPRFTCNVFIQSQQDAWQVLNDLAAVFRGITFWGNDQIYVQADVPQDDVDWVYNVSNVIDGLFTYAGGSYKNRYSSCLVSWSDPQNHYSDTVEGVYDSALVERYDVRQTSLTAIGCTSQSEAHRRGRWVLLSNAKDGTVSFGVGLDGYIPLPAEIIGVADPFRSGKENGGRIRAVNGRQITLDREIDYSAKDRLVVNLPDGKAQTRTISAVSADKITVTVATAFSQVPAAGAVWAIDSDNLAIQYFRVTSIAANDDSTGGFTITAVQHDPNKYRYIDDGVRIESAPITVTPISVLSAPKNIVVTESDHVSQGLTVASLDVSWDKVDGAIRYIAQWRKDSGDWINVPVTSAQGFSAQGIYTGIYDVRVRALNAQETSSPWGYADKTYLSGKAGKPGTPVNLVASDNVVWNINITWAFPDGSGDTAYTEIQRSTTGDHANPQQLTLVPYPTSNYQHGMMPAGIRQWYRARLVDRIGNVGEWTAWVMGETSSQADEYLGDIGKNFMSSEDGKALMGQLETSLEAILQNSLADYDNVNQQWAQYGENKAGIIQASKVAADAEKAVAKLETDVAAQFGDTEAAIQEKMTAYTDASGGSAIYTLKTGIKYKGQNYDAGLSVAVTINGESVDTRVAVNANQFVVMSGSGSNVYSPFAIVNGQVFISDAFIQDGSITNTKIGNYIRSNNYQAGLTGWNIDKTGQAEFNDVTVRGTVYATGGSFTGDIHAEDGEFSGTVSARKFVGDIVALYTYNDYPGLNAPINTKTFTYKDSSSLGLQKTILFQVGCQVRSLTSTETSATIIISINGNEKRYTFSTSSGGSSSGSTVPFVVTHSIVTTADIVSITLREEATGTYQHSLYSPTIMVGRSSGNFSGG